ncbi:MAG: sugar transferase [Cyclobacteriaceae bacterium]
MKAGVKKKYASVVKPFCDKTAAFFLIILCLPIFLFFMLLLLILNRGDVFFQQRRAGKDQKIFSILKFKTMHNHEVSKVGILLRRLSLDELPQLVNVLRGEMSLVGPRPLLVEYLEYYTKEEKGRHTVLPGITGLAQVNGRNKSDWKNRMENDLVYVDKISFLLDCKILMMTVLQLFKVRQADFSNQSHGTFIDYANKR